MITYNLHHLNQEDLQQQKKYEKTQGSSILSHSGCMTNFTYQADFEEKGFLPTNHTSPCVL